MQVGETKAPELPKYRDRSKERRKDEKNSENDANELGSHRIVDECVYMG